jgi:hypothetical protein
LPFTSLVTASQHKISTSFLNHISQAFHVSLPSLNLEHLQQGTVTFMWALWSARFEVCQLNPICLFRFYALFTDDSLQPLIDLVVHGHCCQELGMHGYDVATSKVASADSVAGCIATGGQIFMCGYFSL